jgi:hypothetical protein
MKTTTHWLKRLHDGATCNGEKRSSISQSEREVSGCCNEYGCKRKQPFHIMRGDFTGAWYVVTRWKDQGNGTLAADEKHELPEQYQRALNEAFPPQDETDDE